MIKGLVPRLPSCDLIRDEPQFRKATEGRSCHNGVIQPKLIMIKVNEAHFRHGFDRILFVINLNQEK